MELLMHLWRAILILHPGVELPFNFYMDKDIYGKEVVVFVNGNEKIYADEFRTTKDSIFIKMPVFDSEINAQIIKNEKAKSMTMKGVFINHARTSNNIFPFEASYPNEERFLINGRNARQNFSGKWEVHFSQGIADSSDAIGEFAQNGTQLTGTFLTTTGDDRYLQGNVIDSTMYLSCFDGMHLFLFKATMQHDGTIIGDYWSGAHWHEPWIGKRNYKYELPDADTLMHLKPGYDNISFSFPDSDSTIISFPSDKYKNKVVILQIMGTWCPNCMDETSYLSPYYDKNKSRGLEIIGLDFERVSGFDKAKYNVARLKGRFSISYPILIAGTTKKDDVESKLPMFETIYSYPTTIFIDKKGKVRRIHTGYSGPATGRYYDNWIDDFTSFVDKLLKE